MALDVLLSIIIWITIFCNLFLGFLVFFKNQRNPVYLNLALLAFLSAFWGVGLFFYQHPFFLSSYIWLKIVYADVVCLVGSIFSLSFIFPSGNKFRSYLIPILIYGISAFFFLYTIIFTDYFLANVVIEASGPQQVLGGNLSLFWFLGFIYFVVGPYLIISVVINVQQVSRSSS